MPSVIDILKEAARQELTGDRDFYKSLPYAFKLVTAPFRGPCSYTGEAFFPLPMPPEEQEQNFPFALEMTGTQDAGVISEEAGIVIGELKISATTGFKLRTCRDTSVSGGSGRFMGSLPAETSYNQQLSGHMQLWRLLGRCFDAYSELKKDPETAHQTYLEFHSFKNHQHLEVKPRHVRMIQNPTKYRVTYGYEIQCAIVGPARLPLSYQDLLAAGDDKDLLDYLDDIIRSARTGVQALEATVNDLNACVADVQRHIQGIVGIISDCTRLIESGNDFINGVTSFFGQTSSFVDSLLSDLDEACALSDSSTLPPSATRTLSDAMDSVEQIRAACTGHFKDDWDKKADSHLRHVQSSLRLTDEQIDSIDQAVASADGAGGEMSAADVFDAPYKPGDAIRKDFSPQIPTVFRKQFSGYKEVYVVRGDSIETLAIKHTGNPDMWRAIALINGLRPPYISQDVRLPGTKRVGDKILIPITKPLAGVGVASLGNAAAGASQIEALMGRDIKLVRLDNKHYGWAVDQAHGSTDIQTVYGTPNLIQGLETRMRTEQRTNPQFPGDGLPRMVGEKTDEQLWASARFAFEHQVLADPRIDRILSIRFSIAGDYLQADIDAQPVGYDTNRVIPLQVS